MNYRQNSQRGVGLIEVMVSLLILAVAVLGYVALQGQAIKVTDESLERSQSLVIMRNIAEQIRANPSAIPTYKDKLNAEAMPTTAPSSTCGLDGSAVTTLCSPEQLAEANTYYARQEISDYGFNIQIHPCPSTGGSTDPEKNIMYSYCLFSAWGDTTHTIGTDANKDCLNESGIYYTKATCMMMEL